MSLDVNMMDGSRIPVVVPTRYFAYTSDGRKYSMSAMADFIATCGFDGIDVSFDILPELNDFFVSDDAWRSVLFSLGNRAALLGLFLPVCHLPFYMPTPDDRAAMIRFADTIKRAIRAAAYLKIPTAVLHPIVRHGSVCRRDTWLTENVAFLTPLRALAGQLGVTLAIENMTGKPYAAHPVEPVFGSCAVDVRELADRLDCGVCWDVGHANLTGLCQSAELAAVGDRLRMVHLHDNDGVCDTHLIPFYGDIDWDDVAEGLRAIGYGSMAWRCINLELKTSHLPADSIVRANHATRALSAARRLAMKI